MVLLSGIVLLVSFSFSQFARYWDGRLGKFDDAFTDLRNGWLLDEIIRNVHPYAVLNESAVARFYFEGNLNGFVAVSSQSISQVGVPAVIRLSVLENDDTTFDLVYEEAPMRFATLTQLTTQSDFSAPEILFSGMVDPSFSYFGPEAPRAGEDPGEEVGQKDVWSDSYNAAVTMRHPKRIRFKWSGAADTSEIWEIELIQPLSGQLVNIGEGGVE
jgi:hypothetical protein